MRHRTRPVPVSVLGPKAPKTPRHGGDEKIRKLGFGFKGGIKKIGPPVQKNSCGPIARNPNIPDSSKNWGLTGDKRTARHPGLAADFQTTRADMRREVLAGTLVGAAMLDHGRGLDAVDFETRPADHRTFHHQSVCRGRTADNPRTPAVRPLVKRPSGASRPRRSSPPD
jgi:hypothetical protein